MAFLLGEVSAERSGVIYGRAQARDFPHSLERGRGGASRVVPAQTRAAYRWGGFPLGGIIWYFQSIR